MTAISDGLRERPSQPAFARPIPCSELIVPPRSRDGLQHGLLDGQVACRRTGRVQRSDDVDVEVALVQVAPDEHPGYRRDVAATMPGSSSISPGSSPSGTAMSNFTGTPAALTASVWPSRYCQSARCPPGSAGRRHVGVDHLRRLGQRLPSSRSDGSLAAGAFDQQVGPGRRAKGRGRPDGSP